MTRPARLRALAAVAALLLAACTAGPDGTEGSAPEGGDGAAVGSGGVVVDSPSLRAMKRQAGVENCRPGEQSPPAEDGLPALVLACLGGGPDVDLSTLRGPLVINLWAQWCGPCRDELPYYQLLHERAGDELRVIGIDYLDRMPGGALELVADAGVTYPQLADPTGRVRVPFRVARGLPGVVLVDRDGAVRHIEYVAIRSYRQLRELVRAHLEVDV